ncbi:ATP-dependent zinc metalloprotease FtsH [Faecalispora anaeroviscerum]|uniref:ATP-dependent zinc metalloprotease FtsH n=1 Tax=Faecalispora anaeroviscerum TaxID=2991836 RepID=UPI0024BAE8C7|nr:ATP-dependent zinc metalloprotease FtsH [Faecalispora anaeroviscerum]
MDNKKNLRNLLIYLGAPILIIIIMASIYGNVKPQKAHKYSEIVGYFKTQQVTEYTMDLGSGEMQIALKDGTNVTYTAPNVGIMYDEIHPYIEKYNEDHPDKNMDYDLKRPAETSWLASLIPTILLLAGMLVFWWFMMKRLNTSMGDAGKQMNFGKAKVKQMADEKRKTTFADVAGADEEKEELREIVEFLKNPKKYNELGARIPKGVLLVGPPGTGKTLLARAVAGEAGVPFFSISGSDFVEMFVGVGASRVRDLFDQAKKNSPCIIFIDEIDAVGRQRGAGLGGGHDEREQTLNQLLVEMDGFGANEGVIMIAATNRPDILDPALMRPGRFDRQVMVGYPDIKGREEILKVHARGKPIAPDVSLKTIAKSTAGFTGADLENLLNEAALLSARKNLRAITMEEIEEATIKVVVGAEKKSRVMTEKEKTLTAYHEGGHAVVTYFCNTQDPVHQISIIPRGMAGGYTMQLPTEDRSYKCKKEMLEDLMVLMGGRVAEALVLDDISTGASNDIERATKTARAMVTKYGMSEMLGTVTYGSDNSEPFLGRDMGHVRNYSESTAAAIDKEIKEILTNAYNGSAKVLSEHMDKLHAVAKYLYQNEKMSGEEFQKMMSGSALPASAEQKTALEPGGEPGGELPQEEPPAIDETVE